MGFDFNRQMNQYWPKSCQ